ncbi:helix-turn-helix domain-containing protein [Clostridium gasigenes]|uniref:helix-turn-helix domain-containing protein n=1 Tax=Clostridium gasigenes TaxID=94869 RepID=UPI001C0DADF9|nr:helix-turn-helix transcriptional regulator [Clostridium gasigenes]MBU3102945.1 helix-turn-helix domain-containing protein [Clostridium gasigenes]
MKIGEKLLSLRDSKNMKQRELAELAGITEATLSRYENDKREPKGEIVSRLAQILGVTTDFLLNDNLLSEDSHGSFSTHPLRDPLNTKEKLDIEKEAQQMIVNIDKLDTVEFCGTPADDEDKEYLKLAYEKFLTDVRIYNKQKYTPKKYRK